MMEFVSWDDVILSPNDGKVIKNLPKHQPGRVMVINPPRPTSPGRLRGLAKAKSKRIAWRSELREMATIHVVFLVN